MGTGSGVACIMRGEFLVPSQGYRDREGIPWISRAKMAEKHNRTSFEELLGWLQLPPTLCCVQMSLCSCCLAQSWGCSPSPVQRARFFLISQLLQWRKRAPAAPLWSSALALLGGDAGGEGIPLLPAAAPHASLWEGGSPTSQAALCQKPLIKAQLPVCCSEQSPRFL